MDINQRKYQSSASLRLVVLGMWILFFHEALKSLAVIEMYSSYIGFFILFAALLIEINNGSMDFIKRKYRFWLKSIFVFSLFALLYGIAKSNTLQYLSRDIWPYGYFACLLLAARTTKWKIIDKMIYYQFIVGLGLFTFIWLTLDISFDRSVIALNTRSLTAPHIYLAWGLLSGWQYMLLIFKREDSIRRKTITIIGIILFLVFGIIMLKRQIIIEIGIIIIFKIIYEKKVHKNNIIKMAAVLIAITVVTYSVINFYEKKFDKSYMEGIVARSTEAGSILNTFLKNTRLLETPLAIYNQASVFEVIAGQGLGSAVEKEGVVDTVVESGFFTIFMKGGIIFLLIWYFGLFSIVKDTFIRMRGLKILFGLLSTIFILSSLMAPFFIDYFSTGYKMFWLGKSVSSLKEEGT